MAGATVAQQKVQQKPPQKRPRRGGGPVERAHRGRVEQAARVRAVAMANILTALRGGNPRTAAAAAGKVTPTAFYSWLGDPKMTVDIKVRDENGRESTQTLTFAEAVARAEGEAELFFVSTVRKAATEAEVVHQYDKEGNILRTTVKYDWRAAAWWLERSASTKRNWVSVQQNEVSGPDGGAIPVIGAVMHFKPDEEWLTQYAKAAAELPPGIMEIEGEATEVST